MKKILLIALVFVAGYAATRVLQEAGRAAGAVDSAGPVETPSREIAFVANAVAGTVSLIDVAGAEAVGELNVIPDGARVSLFRDPAQFFGQRIIEKSGGLNYAQDTDLSRDGRVLFVSRGHLGDVAAFDIATGELLWRTPIAGVRADHMAITPDGRRLLVSAMIRGGDKVEILETASGAKIGEFAAGLWPHDVHVTADGARYYSASLGDMTKDLAERDVEPDAYQVTVVDAGSFERARVYDFAAGVRPFQVTADERFLFAQLSNTHAVVKIDLESGDELARLDLPVKDGVSEDDWDFEAPHHGLALSPDETTLCVAGRASDYGALLDAAALSLIETIPAGDAPSWSAFSGDGRFCFLANNRSDDVTVIDVETRAEIARLPVGRGPKHITIGRVPESVITAMRDAAP